MKEQTANETLRQSDGAAVPGADAHARVTTEAIKVKSAK